jgi:hypothetical protein
MANHCNPASIQIRDVPRTAAKQHSATCIDFHCANCNHVFCIFVTRMQPYLSKLPESAPLSQRTNGYPPALSPFITIAGLIKGLYYGSFTAILTWDMSSACRRPSASFVDFANPGKILRWTDINSEFVMDQVYSRD